MEEQTQNSANLEKSLKIANYCIYIAVWVWCIWTILSLYNWLSESINSIYYCIWDFICCSILLYLIFKKSRVAAIFFFELVAHNSFYQLINFWGIHIFNIISLFTTIIWIIWCFNYRSLVWQKDIIALWVLFIIFLNISNVLAAIWVLSESWALTSWALTSWVLSESWTPS